MAILVFKSSTLVFVLLCFVLQQIKQTRQFIEVYVCRGPHNVSVQCGPYKNIVLE